MSNFDSLRRARPVAPAPEPAAKAPKVRGHRFSLRRVSAAVAIVVALGGGTVAGNHYAGDPLGIDRPVAGVLWHEGAHRPPPQIIAVNPADYTNFHPQFTSDGPAMPVSASSPGFSNPNNGPVQKAPQIVLVFWGSQWSGQSDVMGTVIDAYAHLPGSAFAKDLQQYDGAASHPRLVGAWIDTRAPAAADGSALDKVGAAAATAEVNRIAQLTHQTFGPDSQVVMIMPPGVAVDPAVSPTPVGPKEFIAGFHKATPQGVPYAVVSWVDRVSCAPQVAACNSPAGVITVTALHETAEASNDPGAQSWGDYQTGNEVADVCETLPPTVSRLGIPSPYIYSARAGACIAPPVDGPGG